jgi:succinyl-CoA synthetase alpha subunit
MAILVNEGTRAIVQGITGSQGSFHTRLMLDYGTKIVAGVTPGKGGTKIHGIPVYDTVKEALTEHEADASIVFVPAQFCKDAVLEAMDAGLNPIVLITEGIPIIDAMEIIAQSRRRNIAVVGPNTPGVITPERCKLGIMPAQIFRRGKVGVISRSGTLTYEIAYELTRSGLGQSTCVGIGGDQLTGLSFVDVLEMFKEDEETEAITLIGEIGGKAEELAAKYIEAAEYPKPVVAYVAGRTAPSGKRMGHAGAIILGKTGTAESKIEALKSAGVQIAEKPADVAEILVKVLGRKGRLKHGC